MRAASEVFLNLLPNYIHVYAIKMQKFSYFDQVGIIATGILPTPHFSLFSLPVGSKCQC